MTWAVTCPRCGVLSRSSSSSEAQPVCAHQYHAPEDCGVCGWCRYGVAWPPEDALPLTPDGLIDYSAAKPHDFAPLRLGDHPHCARCHVPLGSSEALWNDGLCSASL